MDRPNIAFDIDGIIANFSSPFCYWVSQMYGVKMIPTHNFHWECDPPITEKMFERVIAEFIEFESDMIPVLPEGAELVEYVWANTLRPLLFLTARHERTAGATWRWLKNNFRHIDFQLAVVNSGSDKHRYLKEYDCFIDDRRKTCLDLAMRGHVVFMPQRHYNMIDLDNYYGIVGGKEYNITPPSIWKLPDWPLQGEAQAHQIILLDSSDQLMSGRFDKFIFKP